MAGAEAHSERSALPFLSLEMLEIGEAFASPNACYVFLAASEPVHSQSGGVS